MKKIYITPAMQEEEMEVISMIANSPNFGLDIDNDGNSDIDGGGNGSGLEADGKERDPWADGLW